LAFVSAQCHIRSMPLPDLTDEQRGKSNRAGASEGEATTRLATSGELRPEGCPKSPVKYSAISAGWSIDARQHACLRRRLDPVALGRRICCLARVPLRHDVTFRLASRSPARWHR